MYGDPGELPENGSPFFKKRKPGKAIQMAAIQVSLASTQGISPFSARAALSQSQNPSNLFGMAKEFDGNKYMDTKKHS